MKLFPTIYRVYRIKIYPRVQHIKGSGKIGAILRFLASLSLKRYPFGTNVLEKEWKTLIILDGCRYDLFTTWLGKECDYIISVASSTPEWIKKTFYGKNCSNIIYVSANPFVSNFILRKLLGKNPFFRLEEVWRYGWDEKLKTVPPYKVTKAALSMIKQYPGKRIIIHYLQPHEPFIGKKKLIRKGVSREVIYGKKVGSIWNDLEYGKLTKEEVWEAYYYNLDLVMKEVKRLIQKVEKMIEGKIILTSDHGNHFGEANIYGHPPHLRTEELVKVPWLVITKNS